MIRAQVPVLCRCRCRCSWGRSGPLHFFCRPHPGAKSHFCFAGIRVEPTTICLRSGYHTWSAQRTQHICTVPPPLQKKSTSTLHGVDRAPRSENRSLLPHATLNFTHKRKTIKNVVQHNTTKLEKERLSETRTGGGRARARTPAARARAVRRTGNFC